MNRFDSGSVSAYTPQSFQELAFVPMMKRSQHDEMSKNIAALDAIATDPLNKHRDEALRLKQDFESKLGNISGELASKGIDGIGRENFYRLKKEHDDLIAPTGKIGEINAAKIDYAKQQDEFIKNAEKQNIGRDQALKLWQEKTANYTGYSDLEKTKITNVTPQGVAAFQDYEKYKQVAKSLMGEVESESRSGGYKLVPSSLNNGTMVMVDSKGFEKNSTNLDALNNAIIAGNEMWLKPTGEGYKYNQDAGVNQDNFKQRFIGDFGSMLRTSTGSGYEENGQFINDASGPKSEKDKKVGDLEGVDVEAVKIGDNKQLLKELKTPVSESKFGENQFSVEGIFGTEHTRKPGNEYSAIRSPLYTKLARGLIRTDKSLKGLPQNNIKVRKAVEKYLENNQDVTIQNKFIDPNTNSTGMLFASQNVPKDKKAASQNLLDRVMSGGSKMKDLQGKDIPLDDIKSFTYNGDMTPKSKISIFETPEQNILAHRGYIKTSDGKIKQVYVSRGTDDFNSPQFKSAQLINNISSKIDSSPGLYHPLKSELFENYGLKNVELKYNKGSKTYDMSFTNNMGKQEDVKYSEAKLNELILTDYSNLYK